MIEFIAASQSALRIPVIYQHVSLLPIESPHISVCMKYNQRVGSGRVMSFVQHSMCSVSKYL